MQEPSETSVDHYAANFGTSLRERRLAAGLSQREVAEQAVRWGVKLDPTAVTRVERGERDVKIGEAYVLAAIVGANPTTMISRDAASGYREAEAATRSAMLDAYRSLLGTVHAMEEAFIQIRGLPERVKRQEWSEEEWPATMVQDFRATIETLDVERLALSSVEHKGATLLVDAVLEAVREVFSDREKLNLDRLAQAFAENDEERRSKGGA